MVLQRHGVRHVTCFTHDGPRLHQMLMLTGVDVVQHAVGVQRFIAILRTGDIGGGIEVAAILFLDDDAHRFAFLVFVFIKEHHGGAFALNRQPFGFQIGNDPRQHRVVQALTHHVIAGQGDVQAIVGDLVLRHGDIDQLTPHLQEVLITALQLNHVAARALGEGFVFVIVLFRFAIETFEVGQGHLAGVFLLLFFQIRDQHTELGAPVADVVGADHLMAQEFQGTNRGIANDGRTQMADVHLFCHVRCRVVDDDSLRLRFCDAQALGLQRTVDIVRQKRGIEENIDKARPGDFNLAGNAVEVKMRQYLLCKLSRRHAQLFGDSHHAVGLIVTELNFC